MHRQKTNTYQLIYAGKNIISSHIYTSTYHLRMHKIIHKIETHQAKIALLLFLCLVTVEDRLSGLGRGGRLEVLRRGCTLDAEAGGRSPLRRPGAWPFPGGRRRTAPPNDGVRLGTRVAAPCPCSWPWWSPPSDSVRMSTSCISFSWSPSSRKLWSSSPRSMASERLKR